MNWIICHAVIVEMWWFVLPSLAFVSAIGALICSLVSPLLLKLLSGLLNPFIQVYFKKDIDMSTLNKRHIMFVSFIFSFLIFFIWLYLMNKDTIVW